MDRLASDSGCGLNLARALAVLRICLGDRIPDLYAAWLLVCMPRAGFSVYCLFEEIENKNPELFEILPYHTSHPVTNTGECRRGTHRVWHQWLR